MDFWKNHKLTILLNEAPKPILLVWFFIKDLIKHIFKLFSLSWLGSRKAFNKNVIQIEWDFYKEIEYEVPLEFSENFNETLIRNMQGNVMCNCPQIFPIC